MFCLGVVISVISLTAEILTLSGVEWNYLNIINNKFKNMYITLIKQQFKFKLNN